MHAYADIELGHSLKEPVALETAFRLIDLDRVEVVRMSSGGRGIRGQPDGHVGEEMVVAAPDRLSAPPVSLYPRQLVDADRRLDVHHVVLEPALHHLVVLVALVTETSPGILGHPVKRQHLDACRVHLSAGQHHAPLAGDDVLRHIEAEAAEVAKGTRFTP